ncbi:AzlC family ABC transporter permease [Patulibacter sp. SYSU D01012]|uniref:AzlC family ABC transporter permease n=1 Tax=Patulibacter sp. SYSU D01012 TaxID=2817381 RepID=UPI001B30CF96
MLSSVVLPVSAASSPALRRDVRAALADAGPFAIGMVPLGLAFGLLVVQSGLAWWWAPVFSALVFAGSLEFLLLGLVVAHASLATVAVTTLLVNSRHVFYALSFPLERIRGRLARGYAMFALVDEAYATFAARDPRGLSGRHVVLTQALLQSWWVGGVLVGALAGSAVPTIAGLDFALVTLFVVLAIDALRVHRRVRDAVLAIACALVALVVAPGEMLVVAMALYVAACLVLPAPAGPAGAAEPAADAAQDGGELAGAAETAPRAGGAPPRTGDDLAATGALAS